MKIVAVTSCPTGIAHTYMAAEALERAAKKAGHEIVVETQGAGGKKEIPADILKAADGAVFAADAPVRDRNRFEHLPLVEASVKNAIKDAAKLIAELEEKVSAKG